MLVAVGGPPAPVAVRAFGSALFAGPAAVWVAGVPCAGCPVGVAPVPVGSALVECVSAVAADGVGVGVGCSDYGAVAWCFAVALRFRQPCHAFTPTREGCPYTVRTTLRVTVSGLSRVHAVWVCMLGFCVRDVRDMMSLICCASCRVLQCACGWSLWSTMAQCGGMRTMRNRVFMLLPSLVRAVLCACGACRTALTGHAIRRMLAVRIVRCRRMWCHPRLMGRHLSTRVRLVLLVFCVCLG